MTNFEDLQTKRWFMGKGQKISSIDIVDSVSINGAALQIFSVSFLNGEQDLYADIDEKNIEALLKAFFAGESGPVNIPGQKGTFSAERYESVNPQNFDGTRPLSAEQSNSAFIKPGKFFFKLYRRLLPGIHPEGEILRHFAKNEFESVPRILGELKYIFPTGEAMSLGILEEHTENATSAWDFFNNNMDEGSAQKLGRATAQMHKAMADLPGQGNSIQNFCSNVPFQKLQKLLEQFKDNSRCSPLQELAEELSAMLPKLHDKFLEAMNRDSNNIRLTPQRIHGDFHLGQILLHKDTIKILDFEGEPTRPLEYRRQLLSPAVDIAGMLRSFQYAKACSKKNSLAAEQCFLESYSKEIQVPRAELFKETTPFLLSKAIYEACYELEYRPDWFWIPAKALIEISKTHF